MTDSNNNDRGALTRRRALTGLAAGAGALAAGRLIASEGMPKLAEDDPQAVGLNYKHDASTVDPALMAPKTGSGSDNQHCGNCTLFIDQGGEWGQCPIFAGKLVAKAGWCNVWAPKAG